VCGACGACRGHGMSDGCGAWRVCGASDAPPRGVVENWRSDASIIRKSLKTNEIDKKKDTMASMAENPPLPLATAEKSRYNTPPSAAIRGSAVGPFLTQKARTWRLYTMENRRTKSSTHSGFSGLVDLDLRRIWWKLSPERSTGHISGGEAPPRRDAAGCYKPPSTAPKLPRKKQVTRTISPRPRTFLAPKQAATIQQMALRNNSNAAMAQAIDLNQSTVHYVAKSVRNGAWAAKVDGRGRPPLFSPGTSALSPAFSKSSASPP